MPVRFQNATGVHHPYLAPPVAASRAEPIEWLPGTIVALYKAGEKGNKKNKGITRRPTSFGIGLLFFLLHAAHLVTAAPALAGTQ